MGRGWPLAFRWEVLAEHWHCTPAEARAQSEVDIALAEVRLAAEVEVARRREYFNG